IACIPFAQVQKVDEGLPSVLSQAEQTSSSRIMKGLGSILILQAPADEAWLGLTIPAFAMWFNKSIGWILSRIWKTVAVGFGIGIVLAVAFVIFDKRVKSLGPDYVLRQSLVTWVVFLLKLTEVLIAIGLAQGLIWILLSLLGALI